MRNEFFGNKIINVDTDEYKKYGICVEVEDGREFLLPPQGGIFLTYSKHSQIAGTCDYPFRRAIMDFIK